ncbi:MAG: hypothetical protein IKN63_03550 [Bacilli bacterium]|nr:hypothetical protein [Bacilli bacterium]
MYTKLMLKMRTNFMNLSNEQLINKILSNNILISTLAKEEFLKRDLSNLIISNEIANLIINKFTIEEIWNLFHSELSDNFKEIIIFKLNQILDYYQNSNLIDFLHKKHEDNKIFRLIK